MPAPPGPEADEGDQPPRGPRRPPPSRGAQFRLELGENVVDVKCVDGVPMRVCADITLQLLEKVKGRNALGPQLGHVDRVA